MAKLSLQSIAKAISEVVDPLLRRIEALESRADGTKGHSVRLTSLSDRMEKLETRLQESPPFSYEEVWDDAKEYQKNMLVTFQGSLWIAKTITRSRPGTDGSWQLCVKKGRDGRDK